MTHKFKVGDTVRVIGSWKGGAVGTVGGAARPGSLVIGVALPNDGNYCFLDYELELVSAKTRLYLAGKMRGIPFFNFPAFDRAAAKLRAAGFEVWSPAEHDREVYGEDFEKAYPTGEEDGDFDLRAALAYDTKMICEWADGIALLDGWSDSAGARAERALGKALGLTVKHFCVWSVNGALTPATGPFEFGPLSPIVLEPGQTWVDPMQFASSVVPTDEWKDRYGFGASQWDNERIDILRRFTQELSKATGDGSKKRQAGEKPPWYEDDTHLGAVFSHLTKWYRGEKVDPDSGGHPLGHAAWRLLALACKETGNVPE